jgi:hypothetical protein
MLSQFWGEKVSYQWAGRDHRILADVETGYNVAVEDGMRLAELIAEGQGKNLEKIYDARAGTWEKSVGESEARIAEMHGAVKSSL